MVVFLRKSLINRSNRRADIMTIKELMTQVDVDRVTEAFMLVSWIFRADVTKHVCRREGILRCSRKI